MTKTILITGATDGIGLETARHLAAEGHSLILHGRSAAKLDAARDKIGGTTSGYLADLSDPAETLRLARDIARDHDAIDVIINNAGVYKIPDPVTKTGHDLRFLVNTIAPEILTRELLSTLGESGRVVNLSSAAQSPVDLEALAGRKRLADFEAYAQSKLALTIWSREMAAKHRNGPIFVAVNPGSLLASKMVKDGFGVAGKDLGIGVDILARAALSDSFALASGKYFDNDIGEFTPPHPAALDDQNSAKVYDQIVQLAKELGGA